ncbi:polysaccharide deacetylase family protein [Haloarcula nitratireducens]|uniref:Polysaccharide deacetylase family protein n=1 Tax=Haloarcula nitratireducens TaxID=2487749 RepID=A0AAW4P803_9EURY|nr:polysaccharide deacetylase family protein [Halomicroarcula nitratireducens]MBX0294016.1 polysaccharide deacetylase family protein [Halomicroarcula nitratireducens]
MGGLPGIDYKWDLSAEDFRAQIQELDKRFELVDLATLVDEPVADTKRIAVTFDDGFQNVYSTAVPILREFDVPATLFVSPAFLDGKNLAIFNERHNIPTNSRDTMLTTGQLRQLSEDDLFTIGNHTYSHPDLQNLSDQQSIAEEIHRGKRELEQILGTSIQQFSYPYGSMDDRAQEIVTETHELAVTSVPELLKTNQERYQIPRIDTCLSPPTVSFEVTDISARLRQLARRVNSS